MAALTGPRGGPARVAIRCWKVPAVYLRWRGKSSHGVGPATVENTALAGENGATVAVVTPQKP